MKARLLVIVLICLPPLVALARGYGVGELDLGPDLITVLINSKPQKISDDELDFYATYPESTKKEKLKETFISTSNDNFYISRISYYPNAGKLIFVGFQIRGGCGLLSSYMRRLDDSGMFERIRLTWGSSIAVKRETRSEFKIELYLK